MWRNSDMWRILDFLLYPTVIGVGRNAPVLQLLSDARMRTGNTVANCPIH